MSTLAVNLQVRAVSVACSDTEIQVELADGRRIAVPLVWFPRLADASPEQRNTVEFLGDGLGIRWPEIDEDVSVQALLAGHPSVEFRVAG